MNQTEILRAAHFLLTNPKENDFTWKSEKYRSWILKTKNCYCGASLNGQNGHLHHHRHTGGNLPKDFYLTRFCATCHEKIHSSAKSKAEVYARTLLTDELLDMEVAKMLIEYIGTEKGWGIVLNALALVLKGCSIAAD